MCIFGVYLCFFLDIAIFLRYCCFRHLPSYKFPGPLQTSPSRRVSMIEPIFKSFRGTRAKTSTETFKNPVRRPISGHPPFEIIAIFFRYCCLFEIFFFLRYCCFWGETTISTSTKLQISSTPPDFAVSPS